MSDYENYPPDSLLCDDDPLWDEDEPEEDGSELSEQERAELEVALYSQLHFDHDPCHDLTDREVSSIVIEEEVPESPPDLHELNWRERLLPGLGRVDVAGVGSEQGTVKVNSEAGHTQANTKTTKGKHTLPVQSEKDKQKTKKNKQKTQKDKQQTKTDKQQTKKDKRQTKKDKQQAKKDKQLKAENVCGTTGSVGKGKEKLGKEKKIITKKAEKSITKIVVNDEGHKSKKSLPLTKKAKAKKKGAKEHSDLSKLLYRNEMENKVSALEMKMKKALIRASTPKTNAKRLVIRCTYSDDSDADSDTGPPRKRKKSRDVTLQEMIVIDSISGSELEEGNSNNPIVLHDSSELEMSNIEAEVSAIGGNSDIEEVKPSLSSSRESKISSDDSESSSGDSESSSDESVTEVDADFQMGDIQTNLAGCGVTPRHPREPLGNRPPTEVSLDNLELDDYEELTLEDIHLSLGDCDWGLVSADRYHATKSTTGRYFKKLDVTCHNCKEKGHLSKICPKPWKLPVCQHCGIEGHVVWGCPEPVCFNCLRLGHRREKCTARWRNTCSWCSRCDMQGHSKGECSDLWRQYHVTTEEGALNEVEVESNKRVFCYNCAAEGHWGHECEEERMYRYTLVQLPFIAQYKLVDNPDNTDTPDPHSKARSTENEKAKPKNARTRRENLGEVAKAGKRKRVSPPKKRRTQNEKFEAEYQGMLRKADENWNRNQHNKQSQKRNHTPRTSIKAQHTGDFIRSPKPTSQNYSHKHGRSYSLNEADYRRDSGFSKDNGMGKRRWADRFAHPLPEGHVRERAQSYTGQGRNRGSPKGDVAGSRGRGKQKNRKRQFTSERGFNGYF